MLPLASDRDPEVEFLDKSIIERVIDNISRNSKAKVLAYSTVQRYRQKDLDPCMIGRRLVVDAVTEGEIVRRDDRLRLHLELIDVDTGTQLWGAQFKEVYCDVLASPEELADKISDQLLLALMPDLSKMGNKRPPRAA